MFPIFLPYSKDFYSSMFQKNKDSIQYHFTPLLSKKCPLLYKQKSYSSFLISSKENGKKNTQFGHIFL